MRVREAEYSSMGLETGGIAVLDWYIAWVVTVMVDSSWGWRWIKSLMPYLHDSPSVWAPSTPTNIIHLHHKTNGLSGASYLERPYVLGTLRSYLPWVSWHAFA